MLKRKRFGPKKKEKRGRGEGKGIRVLFTASQFPVKRKLRKHFFLLFFFLISKSEIEVYVENTMDQEKISEDPDQTQSYLNYL